MTRLMNTSISAAIALAATALATAASADGDAAKGEKEFRKCVACHSVIAADGTAVVKGGKVGPNLFAVIGRPVASIADFKYGDGIKALGASGATWDEAGIASYVADPTAYLKDKTGDAGAKSNMSFKLAKGAEDVAAYLATLE